MDLLESPLLDRVRRIFAAHASLSRFAVFASGPVLLLCLLYYLALPKPFAGIPYKRKSARRILGDVPDMIAHINATEGTFITFLLATIESLNGPIGQIFYSPFRKPIVILADYAETTAVLRSKDFDRSSKSIELLKYLGPKHHIRLRSNAQHKAQRRLIQDSMSPAFLNNVAGPTVHRRTLKLLELWRTKCEIADGRPWSATHDLDYAVLDAVNGFAFGQNFPHSALKPSMSSLKELDDQAIKALLCAADADSDRVVRFPTGQMEEVIRASMDVSQSIEQVQGSIWPSLRWEYVIRQPYLRRSRRIKDEFVMKELRDAAKRMETESQAEKSAVDLMVRRAKETAQKEGKKPDYCSQVMIDEAFGFLIAGADTTSTTLSWGVKLLADNPLEQTKLRTALQEGFSAAKLEKRNPTVQEITGTSLPYLDAWLEESLRTGGAVPMIDREAMVDTQILGHHIPKGTGVLCLQRGPSLLSPGFKIDDSQRNNAFNSSSKAEASVKSWDAEDIASFKPERWLRRGAEGDQFDPNAGPQLAFGHGPRRCFGPRLAYLQMRILVTLLVWNFELLPCPKALSGYGSVMVMTSRPRHCYVRLKLVSL